MELDRSHTQRTTTTAASSNSSELFICFSSRPSNYSSSMRLTSSKSIVSPGRGATDKSPNAISLSHSLSRRLRNNGSLKGGQSPMFPSTISGGGGNSHGKKKGCNFDSAEPSSPKVTCIGQVRVKTKKQGKKMKMRACGVAGSSSGRRQQIGGNGTSLRRTEQGSGNSSGPINSGGSQHLQRSLSHHLQQQQDCLTNRNQKWLHFPESICESLKAFGSEFSCFLPCYKSNSSCYLTSNYCNDGGSVEREKTHEHHRSHLNNQHKDSNINSSSCAAVFRWLVALHEGDGKSRDIELVVEGEEDEKERLEEARKSIAIDRECSSRRSIFDDMDFSDEKLFAVKDEDNNAGEGRASICVPPKNALLLMRCRSDPMKVNALVNKLCETPYYEDDTTDDTDEGDKDASKEREEEEQQSEEEDQLVEKSMATVGAAVEKASTAHQLGQTEEEKAGEVANISEEMDDSKSKRADREVTVEDLVFVDAVHGIICQEMVEDFSIHLIAEKVQQELVQMQIDDEEGCAVNRQSIDTVSSSNFSESFSSLSESPREYHEGEDERDDDYEMAMERATRISLQDQIKSFQEVVEQEDEVQKKQKESSNENVLPDCLLLMMREPKLSMEVSKETWLCHTDFVRCLPDRQNRRYNHHQNSKAKDQECQAVDAASNVDKKNDNISSQISSIPTAPIAAAAENELQVPQHLSASTQQHHHPPGFQPARSSCSFPYKGGISMASLIEQKFVNPVAYEPFVLTRCKSAPMRSAAVKFGPNSELACFWKNRKFESLRQATYRVGATGLGF